MPGQMLQIFKLPRTLFVTRPFLEKKNSFPFGSSNPLSWHKKGYVKMCILAPYCGVHKPPLNFFLLQIDSD